MVLIERISYEIGGVLADIVLLSVLPSSSFTIYKLASKVSHFASSHSTLGFTDVELTENIIECLPFME